MEREKTEPEWGDPTYRVIPRGTVAADIYWDILNINYVRAVRSKE